MTLAIRRDDSVKLNVCSSKRSLSTLKVIFIECSNGRCQEGRGMHMLQIPCPTERRRTTQRTASCSLEQRSYLLESHASNTSQTELPYGKEYSKLPQLPDHWILALFTLKVMHQDPPRLFARNSPRAIAFSTSLWFSLITMLLVGIRTVTLNIFAPI